MFIGDVPINGGADVATEREIVYRMSAINYKE
jgi:hypothetical protein